MDPIDAGGKIGEGFQKGGLAFALGLAVAVIAIQWWVARKDAFGHAKALKDVHDECAKALAAAAADFRRSEEAKNERILSFGTKLTEVIVENTGVLERIMETQRDRSR